MRGARMHPWRSAQILLVMLVYCSAAAGADRHLLQTRATGTGMHLCCAGPERHRSTKHSRIPPQ